MRKNCWRPIALRCISAFSDVENALGKLAHLTAQEAALTEQVAQAEKVLGAAQRKYLGGYSDFSP